MEKLTHLMQLIDAHSDTLPEGVYLDMCNSIKSVHEELNFTPELLELEMDVSETDTNNYRDLEKSLHTHVIAMETVMKDMEKLKPRKRLSNKLKTEAIKKFATETGLHSLREYTERSHQRKTRMWMLRRSTNGTWMNTIEILATDRWHVKMRYTTYEMRGTM